MPKTRFEKGQFLYEGPHATGNLKRENIRLWLDLSANINDRSDFSGEIAQIKYELVGESSEESFGDNTYNIARFDNSENKNALVQYSSSNNPLKFNDGTNDLPFSISFLFNRSSQFSGSSSTYFFAKGDNSFLSFVNNSGVITFYIMDDGSNYLRVINAQIPNFTEDTWYHLVFTYDGSKSGTGINVYADGNNIGGTKSVVGTYLGMANTTDELYVGASASGTTEFDGYMAEFTIFDKELTQEEISDLYFYLYNFVSFSLFSSGNINNPVRVLLKEEDSRSGKLPTKLRFGTYDRKGSESINYNDNNTVRYGNRIYDSFKFKNNSSNTDNIEPNNNIWSFSPGITIRREEKKTSPDFNDGVLIFSGEPDNEGRWIQTKEKVRNPTLTFEILQGPYQSNSDKLNLSQGEASDVLKIQASEDGATWEDIPIKDRNVVNSNFLNGNSYFTPTLGNRRLNLNIDGKIKKRKEKRLATFVKLDVSDFNMQDKDYYIRIIQDSVSDNRKSVWGIEYINIISRNDSIEYPLLARQDLESFSLSLTGAIASPNILSDLFATGSSVKNLTDHAVSFDSFEESILFFNDNRSIDDNGDKFYDEGVDNDLYPGFNSSLKSKDVIEIDLSTTTPEPFGLNNKFLENSIPSQPSPPGSIYDTSGDGYNFMVFWNKDLKKWEKVGDPVTHNNFSDYSTEKIPGRILTSSCVGFAPFQSFLANSGSMIGNPLTSTKINIEDVVDKSLLTVSNKMTTAFNFPYGVQYNATSSQTIKARELGINKPFLLEKTELIFNATFNFADWDTSSGGSEDKAFPYSLRVGRPQPGAESLSRSALVTAIVPTFFIARQFKSSYDRSVKLKFIEEPDKNDDISYNIKVPSVHSDRYVDTSRELITYDQIAIFNSSSSEDPQGLGYVQLYKNNELMSLEEISDLYDFNNNVLKYNNTNVQESISGNFKISSPVKKSNNILGTTQYFEVKGEKSGLQNFGGVVLENENKVNFSSNRKIVNNVSSYNLSSVGKLPGRNAGANLIDVQAASFNKQDLTAPYLILPDDDIILGWQYPVPRSLLFGMPALDYAPNKFYEMILEGKSKLKLYGSLVKKGKEYHEGLNQNLTTESVHEIVGDDAILDQFQIATVGELTGSWITGITTAVESDYSGETAVFGSLIFPKFIKNTEPFKRIGGLVVDILAGLPQVLNQSVVSNGIFTKNSFNIVLSDTNRVYQDCYYLTTEEVQNRPANVFNDVFFVQQEYGILPSIKATALETTTGTEKFYGINPNYQFSSTHFGHVADIIQQGRDGKFVDDPSTSKDDIVTSSPVSVKFVKGAYIDEDLSFRKFTLFDVEKIDGTSEKEFQSSNLSLAAASVSAFYDDGLARNRAYNIDWIIFKGDS